jgi:hypothetical protein
MSAPEKQIVPPIPVTYLGGTRSGERTEVAIGHHVEENRRTGEIYHRYGVIGRDGKNPEFFFVLAGTSLAELRRMRDALP